MSTLSYDFTLESVEDPISIGGEWGNHYNGGVDLIDNGGNVSAAAPIALAGAFFSTVLATKGTYARKQYAECTIGANTIDDYSTGPGVYLDSSGDGYYLRMYDLANGSSGAVNRLYKIASGSRTNLSWMSNTIIGAGDKVGILVEANAADTDISFYFNPTTYDGDGFPTDGFKNTHTDTSAPITSGQAGIASDYLSNADSSFVPSFYSAGYTAAAVGPSITGITPDPTTTGATLTVTGTGFTPDTGSNGTKQEQGAVVVNLTESARSATEITVPSATIESTNLKYGTQTLRVTTDAGNTTKTFVENPATGNGYVDATSIATVGPIIAIPDLAIGDQIAYGNVTTPGGFDVVVNADTSISIDAPAETNSVEQFSARAWDASDPSWGTAAVQTVTLGTVSGGDGIPAEDDTATPDHFNNSLPYNSDSELAIDSTSAIDTISNGIPYSANGRICVSLAEAVTRVDTGTPFDTNDKVAMSISLTDRVEGGTPFTADGQIAVEL